MVRLEGVSKHLNARRASSASEGGARTTERNGPRHARATLCRGWLPLPWEGGWGQRKLPPPHLPTWHEHRRPGRGAWCETHWVVPLSWARRPPAAQEVVCSCVMVFRVTMRSQRLSARASSAIPPTRPPARPPGREARRHCGVPGGASRCRRRGPRAATARGGPALAVQTGRPGLGRRRWRRRRRRRCYAGHRHLV